MEIEKSSLWYENYKSYKDEKIKYIINQGGMSSGKTFSIVDLLLYIIMTEKNVVVTITGANFPAINRGAGRDLRTIWNSSDIYKKFISEPNQGGCKCEITGSIIELAVFYNREVSKGSKRDYLFINEATSFNYEIAFELMSRTKKKVFLDYNPNNRFWVHEKFEGTQNSRFIFSTHKANKFLPQSMHDEIEKLKVTDPERYRVYGLGECGKTEGCVYSNWVQVEDIPNINEYKKHIFGMDFGFTNDPTTLVFIGYVNGELYVKEWLFKTGMTNFDIFNFLKENNLQNETIIADSAEMKSISELKKLGCKNIKPAIKGQGSVNQGINLVKTFKMNVEKCSNNLKSELLNYKWEIDNLGHFSNKPIDKFNHLLDSLRYGTTYLFDKGNVKSGIQKIH